jgi:hypothetical protein
MTYQAGREGDDREKRSRLHFWFDLGLPVGEVEKGRRPGDRKVDQVLSELRRLGSEIDLLDFIRKHIESVARVFEKFRKLIGARLDEAEGLIAITIDRAKQDEDGDVVGLAAIVDGRGRVQEEVPLFEDMMKYGRALRAKNRGIESISKRFVSSVSRTLNPRRRSS